VCVCAGERESEKESIGTKGKRGRMRKREIAMNEDKVTVELG